ncbi:MAG: dodecin domain-containing protein [Deinococcales bacterium]|nr:dodecin domain-containing protein [Deinococcales bacterium]
MSVVKVIELLAQSEQSWEDATKKALQEASRTIRGIKSIYVKDFQAIVEDGQITHYRVNVKVSFTVDSSDGGGSGEPAG